MNNNNEIYELLHPLSSNGLMRSYYSAPEEIKDRYCNGPAEYSAKYQLNADGEETQSIFIC